MLNNLPRALSLHKLTPNLKFADILPMLPSFTSIGDYREEITEALEKSAKEVSVLRRQLEETALAGKITRNNIAKLEARFILVDERQRCDGSGDLLLNEDSNSGQIPIYGFPCSHAFRADWLIDNATKTMSQTDGSKLQIIRQQLIESDFIARHGEADVSASKEVPTQDMFTQAAYATMKGILTATDKLKDYVVPDTLVKLLNNPQPEVKSAADTNEKTETLNRLRREIEDIITERCPICYGTVEQVDQPFMELRKATWEIS